MKNSSSKELRMKLERELDQLSEVKKVAVPEHLYAAIESQIQNQEVPTFSALKVWSLGIAASLLLIASISIGLNQNEAKKPTFNYAQEMNLVPQNQLYR